MRRSQFGVLWNFSEPEEFDDVLPAIVVSPSYKVNDNLTTYISWQYGEKAGISQQVFGNSVLADAEETAAWEIGVKTTLLNNTLGLSPDLDPTLFANSYRDASGEDLPGAPRWSFNVGPVGVFVRKIFHTSANWAFQSSQNTDTSLSVYGEIPSNSLWDLSAGVGTVDEKFDVSLIVKNAFNNDVPLTSTWNTYTPSIPRWIGLEFSGKL